MKVGVNEQEESCQTKTGSATKLHEHAHGDIVSLSMEDIDLGLQQTAEGEKNQPQSGAESGFDTAEGDADDAGGDQDQGDWV